jgi:hypothetical protein
MPYCTLAVMDLVFLYIIRYMVTTYHHQRGIMQ